MRVVVRSSPRMTVKRTRPGRALYREWVRQIAASGAVLGVELVVGARTDGFTYFTGLQIPRWLGQHYRVTSIEVGDEEILSVPTEASDFAEDSILRPSFMISARRGTNIFVWAVKTNDHQVPFVCTLLGMERVRSPRRGELSQGSHYNRGRCRRKVS